MTRLRCEICNALSSLYRVGDSWRDVEGREVWLCEPCLAYVPLQPGQALYDAETVPQIAAVRDIFQQYHQESIESEFLGDLLTELSRARIQHAPLHSLHEAYAVILEAVDELWEEVRKKREERDAQAVRQELLQIAAMCWRTAFDCHLTHSHR